MLIRAKLIERRAASDISLADLQAPPPTQQPLVSCLMVTRGRLFPARYAIDCYRRQTYERRELVVVVDDPSSPILGHVAALGDPSVRVVHAPAGTSTLGELRNVAVGEARGEFVCQWDDDDLYDPERIGLQLAALLKANVQACILGSWTIWWPQAQRLAISGWRLWEGSILASKALLPRYPALRRGEDTVMVNALVEGARVVQLDAPELYVYTHHGANTFGEAHFREIYNASRARWVGAGYEGRVRHLSARFPIEAYRADLGSLAESRERHSGAEAPLVSIIVRSMGRPELSHALGSLAAQEYPRLEVIVVDATGGNHPPLPELAWRHGHSIRLVSRGVPLKRPSAANAGLDEVRGEWFGFLDDDDDFDADHIAVLVDAGVASGLPVVYGLSRLVRNDGMLSGVAGLPFNRALMFMGPLFCFPAALIRREVIDWGCRFDEDMEISEDRDFFAQLASRTDFAFVDLATFNYRVELGTSGTGQGMNQQRCRNQLFEQRLRSKWIGPGTYHSERAMRFVYRALAAYQLGDRGLARQLLETSLEQYPDEPNATSALGALLSEAGELQAAEVLLHRAVKMWPTVGDYRLALAVHHERLGDTAGARQEALAALSDPASRPAAETLLSRLGPAGGTSPTEAHQARPAAPAASVAQPPPQRLAPCPCGSGKRYRDCCGALAKVAATPAPAVAGPAAVARRALDLWRMGEAAAALGELRAVVPGELSDPAAVFACAELCREMEQYQLAYAFLERAEALGEAQRAAVLVGELCVRWHRDRRRESLARTIRWQIERLGQADSREAHPARQRAGPIHIVSSLGQLGGTENQALALYQLLAGIHATEVWSVTPPLPAYLSTCPVKLIEPGRGQFPAGGHLVFVGNHFSYGDWLHACRARRVTIAATSYLPEQLIARLVQIEEMPLGFSLDLTFPSDWFRDVMGLPGDREYPFINVERFSRLQTGMTPPRPFTVGRHSRSDIWKFHPNDPAFFRRLTDAGHRLRVLGGGYISQAMSAQPRSAVELLPEGSLSAEDFLSSIDCFVYRVHPAWFETCGIVVLEAMAAGLPVVLFGQGIGAAELLRHGENGFLVSTEEEALACLGTLARDPALRRAMGESARQTVTKAMRDQRERILLRYQ